MLGWLIKEEQPAQAAAVVRSLISVPDQFDDGDMELWLKRFGMCATANGWDAARQLVYLPTFLRASICGLRTFV